MSRSSILAIGQPSLSCLIEIIRNHNFTSVRIAQKDILRLLC